MPSKSLLEIMHAANELSDLLESSAPKGLRKKEHAKSIKPARAKIKAVMVHFFERQRKAVLAAVKPHIARQLMLHPVPVKESGLVFGKLRESSPPAKTFARSLMPTSLHPLTFSATAGETSEYNEAITDLIGAAAKSLGQVAGPDFAGEYLAKNSLSKLTGGLDKTSIERLQDALATAWDKGGDYDSMVSAITDTFDDFTTTRAERIAQTEANDAYSDARHEIAVEAGLDEKRWDPDGEACPECQANADQGWIDIDEDFDSGDDAPTAHPGCFLGETPVVALGITAAFRRRYEGAIYTLQFSGGTNFSVTPNHPILTRRGWAAVSDLEIGEDVLQCSGPTDPATAVRSIDPDFDKVEASIEKIFDALSMSGGVTTAAVPLSTEAFHGDGQIDTEVHVVWSARAVSRYVDRFKFGVQPLLTVSERRRIALNSQGHAAALLKTARSSPHGIMSSLGAGGVELFGQSRVGGQLGGAVAALLEPNEVPSRGNAPTGDTDPFRHCEDTFTGQVGFVKLLEINIRYFSGHVFNLSTNSGMYLANTIVAHNCDCGCDYRKSSEEE